MSRSEEVISKLDEVEKKKLNFKLVKGKITIQALRQDPKDKKFKTVEEEKPFPMGKEFKDRDAAITYASRNKSKEPISYSWNNREFVVSHPKEMEVIEWLSRANHKVDGSPVLLWGRF